MIKIVKQAEVFSPAALGINDILICDGRVARIAPDIDLGSEHIEIIDGTGKVAFPGLVDSLVHISGGGGEGGFQTRTPQMQLSDATKAGVTTVIGALGTDATTRSLADLLAKTRALEEEGLTAYCYTGSYQLPARTITGSVTDDIILIDKMIGIGEVAIADHRSSQPDNSDIARVASEARVGGMLSGKAGIVSIHVGDSLDKLNLLHKVNEQSDIPASQFYPTHINRNQQLLDAGVTWCRVGGYIDFTTSTNQQFIDEGEIPAAAAVAYCLQQGIDIAQLTMSSDGNASLPVFDHRGQLTGLEVGLVSSLYDSFKQLVQQHNIPMPTALACVTQSPADILRLTHKGRLIAGVDADIVIADKRTLDIDTVIARGQVMVAGGEVKVKGTFE